MDYCPVTLPYSNTQCGDPLENPPNGPPGTATGPTSRCFASTHASLTKYGCFPQRCVAGELEIDMGDGDGYKACAAGATITSADTTVVLQCPTAAEDFCNKQTQAVVIGEAAPRAATPSKSGAAIVSASIGVVVALVGGVLLM